MSLTSRELVLRPLNLDDPPRAPRELWTLPIAQIENPVEYEDLVSHFSSDFQSISGHQRETSPTLGESCKKGIYVDAWGARFVNIHEGIIREVRDPLVQDWSRDTEKVHIPEEWLSVDQDAINRDCAASSKFTRASCIPHPFEQLQFLRGTADLYITFWGEMDRQHLPANGSPEDVDRAVRKVYPNLWSEGGCIAQCEYGAAAKPDNVRHVFKSWDALFGGSPSDDEQEPRKPFPSGNHPPNELSHL